MIEWNRVTWYSKLLAAIFLLGVFPALTFYIGTQYERVLIDLKQENNHGFSVAQIRDISPSNSSTYTDKTGQINQRFNRDTKTITASDLAVAGEGYWFTPHSAGRNITFSLQGNLFNFNSGELNKFAETGTYSIKGLAVTLAFKDKSRKDMVLYFSQDLVSMNPDGYFNSYLKNDQTGEYFVFDSSPHF